MRHNWYHLKINIAFITNKILFCVFCRFRIFRKNFVNIYFVFREISRISRNISRIANLLFSQNANLIISRKYERKFFRSHPSSDYPVHRGFLIRGAILIDRGSLKLKSSSQTIVKASYDTICIYAYIYFSRDIVLLKGQCYEIYEIFLFYQKTLLGPPIMK